MPPSLSHAQRNAMSETATDLVRESRKIRTERDALLDEVHELRAEGRRAAASMDHKTAARLEAESSAKLAASYRKHRHYEVLRGLGFQLLFDAWGTDLRERFHPGRAARDPAHPGKAGGVVDLPGHSHPGKAAGA